MDILYILVTFLFVFGCCDVRRFNSISKKRNAKQKNFELLNIPEALTVPVMIHFDHSLAYDFVKQHRSQTRKMIKTISNDILRQVKKIFLHPTLHQNITFNLLEAKMLKNNSNSKYRDATRYLESYCKWQATKKAAEDRLYFSVLLTGIDLYHVDTRRRKDLGSKGRGYMYGMCARHKSCSLLEYNPQHIGHTLTHEIAHSLGVSHDGQPSNQCESRGHVMSSLYSPLEQPHTWTPCNKRDLKRFLMSRKSWCLRNGNVDRSSEHENRI